MSNFDLDDVLNIEDWGVAESADEYYKSLQRAINSGEGWRLQGSFGRAMMAAIEGGACMLGSSGCRDYWGNYIPSRDEVVDGSKGSRGYVVKARGEEWAAMLEAA
jgi:hypothetical protein